MIDPRQGEKESQQGYILLLAMVMGDQCSQCLIQKTLIYKTLKSHIKCALELSAGGLREEMCLSDLIPSSSGMGPHMCYLSSTLSVPNGSPLHGPEKLQGSRREVSGFYLIYASGCTYVKPLKASLGQPL